MFDRIDIYTKKGRHWVYLEGTRMHPTLASAQRQYGPGFQARWSEKLCSRRR